MIFFHLIGKNFVWKRHCGGILTILKIFLTKIFFSTIKYEIIKSFTRETTKKFIYNEKKFRLKKVSKCALKCRYFYHPMQDSAAHGQLAPSATALAGL